MTDSAIQPEEALKTPLLQMHDVYGQLATLAEEWREQMSWQAKIELRQLIKRGEVNAWDEMLLNHHELPVLMAASMSRQAETMRQDIQTIAAYGRKPDLRVARKREEIGEN